MHAGSARMPAEIETAISFLQQDLAFNSQAFTSDMVSQRILSPVLSKSPWSTGAIRNRDSLNGVVDSNNTMARYLEVLQTFEDSLFTSRSSTIIFQRNILQLQLSDSPGPSSLMACPQDLAETNHRGWAQLLSTMTSYRLADVIAHINGVEVQNAPVFEKRQPGNSYKALELWNHMEDWVKLLNNFKDIASQAAPQDLPTSSDQTHISLLKWCAHYDDRKNASKIMINILVAAMHLAVLRSRPFSPEQVPDIVGSEISSSTPSGFEHAVFFPTGEEALRSLGLNEKEVQFACKTFRRNTETSKGDVGAQERTPLELALFVSPIYLLIPSVLMKRRFGRRHIAETFWALGNCKPPILVSVEQQLWRAIFSLADGTLQPESLMSHLLDSLPDFGSCVPEDRAWFSFNCPQLQVKRSSHRVFKNELTAAIGFETAHNAECGDDEGGPAPPAAASSAKSTTLRFENIQEGTPLADSENSVAEDLENLSRASSMDLDSDCQGVAEVQFETGTSLEPPSTSPIQRQIPQLAAPGPGSLDVDSDVQDSQGHRLRAGRPIKSLMATATASRPTSFLRFVAKPKSAPSGPVKHTRPSASKAKGMNRHLKNKGVLKRKGEVLEERAPQPIDFIDLTTDSWLRQSLTDDMEVSPQSVVIPACTAKKIRGEEIQLYTPVGEVCKLTPIFHHQEILQTFTRLVTTANNPACGGRPLHIVDPSRSSLRVMSKAEFERSPIGEIQAIFRKQHILVTDDSFRACKFDRRMLERIVPAKQTISINDMSVKAVHNLNSRVVKGTIEDVLRHAVEEGKALNALDLPMEFGVDVPEALGSDMWAWQQTIRKPHCKPSDHFPTSVMRWALVSTAGTHTCWHTDAEGLGTMVEVRNEGGLKVWFVGVEREGGAPFSGLTTFLNGFDVEMPNTGRWDVEAIVLTPGVKFFMRPNTPHFVYTPTNTICYGGHFYATSTIRESCYGLMHSFIAHRVLSNASHEVESRELIRRMITYYHETLFQFGSEKSAHGEHTLDIGSIEGFIDFLTLFNTAELFNALYTPSYDKSRISIREMLRFMEARRLCRRILTWFSTHYDLLSGDDLKTSPFELQKKYFNGQLRALLRYKHLEEMNLKEGEVAGEEEQVEEADILPRIGFSQLRKMIELSVDGGIEAVQVYYRLLKEDPDDHYFQSLSWSSSEKYRLRRTSSCLDESQESGRYAEIDGFTVGDRAYVKRYAYNKRTKRV